MTDLEYGRAWAAQQRLLPGLIEGIGFRWDAFGNLPFAVRSELTRSWWSTENEAFAALGSAVRAVHAAVPQLRDPTG